MAEIENLNSFESYKQKAQVFEECWETFFTHADHVVQVDGFFSFYMKLTFSEKRVSNSKKQHTLALPLRTSTRDCSSKSAGKGPSDSSHWPCDILKQ